MSVKVNAKTNEVVKEKLKEEFPSFTVRCNLGERLKERGLSLEDLSNLTGIRVATISELINMKRSTISTPHLLVIAKVLRISDITQLYEFTMSEEESKAFEHDQEVIEQYALLPEQEETLIEFRRKRAKELAERRRLKKIETQRKHAEKKKQRALEAIERREERKRQHQRRKICIALTNLIIQKENQKGKVDIIQYIKDAKKPTDS